MFGLKFRDITLVGQFGSRLTIDDHLSRLASRHSDDVGAGRGPWAHPQRNSTMSRFLKGTTDHDSDGKMGGSLKETDMATTKKTAAPKKAAAKKPVVKADGQNQMNSAAAAQAEESAHTAQTGMAPGKSAKELRAEHNARFAEADAKAQAALTEEAQVGLQVRGY